MNLFRRALGWFFLLLGILTGIAVSAAALFARRMTRPPKQRLWATPADVDIPYEEVRFSALDGVRLSGWFLPAPADSNRKGATIVLVHGWLWNRLGDAAEDALSGLAGVKGVDLLRLALHLHSDGFHVFLFDLRNHGESVDALPVTFGWHESNDLLGALDYLKHREDVSQERIGVIGFSMGANAALYTLPKSDDIQAAVVVQPFTFTIFSRRFLSHLLSFLSPIVYFFSDLLYRGMGGPAFSSLRPGFAAANASNTPVLFVQGEGDPWGSVEDVREMAAASPQARGPLIVDATGRTDAFQYVVDNPQIMTAFFEQHFPE